jgi:NADH-quinone oxidoreductase subunit L
MVTAGVYLVARSYALYSAAPAAQSTVAWVGGLTALFAATIAVGQFDIKRVLAYSTISQLGFMVAAVGMGAYVAGMFHLITHAFFKALLFLAAGSVIQGVEAGEHHPKGGGHGPDRKGRARPPEPAEPAAEKGHFDAQDMRTMGGLRNRMKLTYRVYLAGALALAGIFPFSGFFSKDEILAAARQLQPGVLVLLVIAAFLTAFYIGRQVSMVFLGTARSEPAAKAKENPPILTVPLVILAILATVGGALNLPGVHSLETWLEHTLEGVTPVELNVPLALVALGLAVLGLYLGWLLYGRRPLKRGQTDPLQVKLGPVFTGMAHKWWVDEAYNAAIIEPYKRLCAFLAQGVDLGFIDALGNGLGSGTRAVSAALRRLQTGFVRSYALVMLFGAVVILGYLIFQR